MRIFLVNRRKGSPSPILPVVSLPLLGLLSSSAKSSAEMNVSFEQAKKRAALGERLKHGFIGLDAHISVFAL